MNTPTLPPGLADKHTEFFMADGELMFLSEGKAAPFIQIPEKTKAVLVEEMLSQPEIMAAFFTVGVFRQWDQLYTYTKCMYGGFDNSPDITENGLATPDNHSCNCNNNCCLSQVVKNNLPVANGHLTPREIELVKLLALNYPGKQIASKMGISENTVNKHKQNIFFKTGLTSNVELAVWATNSNLI